MAERGKFSIEDLKRIGWRLKSARSLTGLNQEEFAAKSDIPYMTIKGWELGRALPRQDGINRFLLSIESFGIQISPEWIIFGEGNGPIFSTSNYNHNNDRDDTYNTSLIIKAFKDEQRKMGHNPIVIKIDDNLMSPRYKVGDIIGGIIISINELRKKFSSEGITNCSWLIPADRQEWIVRDIFFSGERVFTKAPTNADIVETNIVSAGKIIWHYFVGEQT